ncbi:phage portal protein [Clostridium sp. 001]|uniref:phage portal protein n=1 Tax=Clostridium sp. 001 TaxID=1970093 RepID=UPI001C2C6033|nr:phage portal protein [Clostridium sp. 001]QXE19995.1 phage portal protein [Clostridium sp. 001]
MKLWDWVKGFFGQDKDTVYVNDKAIENQETQLDVKMFATSLAISFIANTISKCEFKTYLNGKEVKGDEYYLWNVEPNVNQNAPEFIAGFITNLLFNGEALAVEVNGQLINADSFSQQEYAVVPNSFTNVTSGTMNFNKTFYMSDVLYLKMDNPDMQKLLINLLDDYTNIINVSIGKYKRSGGRKGIAKIDKAPSGDTEYKKKIDDLFQNKFKNYFEAENAVVNLPKGVEYEENAGDTTKKSTSDVIDIESLVKEAFQRAAQALKIPPSLLLGDIANDDGLVDDFLTFCIDPLCNMLQKEINRKRYGKKAFLAGSYLSIDTTCIKHIDVFEIAEKIDKLIASGMYGIDELRTKAKDTMLNTDWSGKHWITKNYQEIDNLEGGESSG